MITAFLTAQLSNLLFASGLAAFTYFITKVWKNPNLAHALWLLVLLKLLTPPLVTVSPPGFLLVDSKLLIAEQTIDTALTLPQEENSSNDEMDPISPNWAIPPVFSDKPLFVPAIDSRSAVGVEYASILSWPQWLLLVWGLGLCAYVFVALRRHLCLLRVITESQQPDAVLKEDAQRIARQMGVVVCPQLRITSVDVCPLVLGGWRKQVILLPTQLLSELSRDQIRSVLAHELAHIRRRDHFVRFFEIFVLALHWWNPLAWLASWKLQQAEEECCDAWVTWALPEHRRSYGQTLLQTVEFLTEKKLLRPATGTFFGKCFLERRINMILNQTVNRKMSRAACLAIFAVGMLVLPIAFAQEFTTESSPPKVGENLAATTLSDTGTASDTDTTKDLAAWARQHGGSFDGAQLTLDIYDSNSPTYGKSNLEDADLEFLSQIDTDSVRALYLRGHAISDEGLKHIAQLTELRILSVFSNNISSHGIKHLLPLRHLTSLTILSHRIDDTAMKYFADMNLDALRKFNMPSRKITSAGLKDFCASNLSNLRSLGLSRTRINNSGLSYLSQLPALEELYLNVTNIDDHGLAHIATVPKLRKLSLRKTKITDSGLKSLLKSPRLSSLNLESTIVSDKGILQLAALSGLLEIALADTNVTRAGFEKLQSLNPNITILFSPVPIIEAGNTPRKK